MLVEGLAADNGQSIRITLRNMSQDLTLENIHFRIECFDLDGNPMICNTDGESTFFEGDYPFVLAPYERTAHGAFRFNNFEADIPIGSLKLTILSWKDSDGYTWYIPEADQLPVQWTTLNYNYNNPGQGVG